MNKLARLFVALHTMLLLGLIGGLALPAHADVGSAPVVTTTNVNQLNGQTILGTVNGELNTLVCDASVSGRCQTVNNQGAANMTVCDAGVSTSCARASNYGNSDGNTANLNSLATTAFQEAFNGTSMDRLRTVLPSATVGITCSACSSTQTGTDQTNYNSRGVKCVYDVTADVSSGSFTPEIDGKDEVSGKYYAILTGAAKATTGTVILTVYPGITASSNIAVSDVIPRTWRAVVTYNSGTSQTFTFGCSTLL